jgi:acetylglutamate kinase
MVQTLPASVKDALAAARGERFVVKLSGEIMLNAPGLDALAADIAHLAANGIYVIVVHGGGPQADALAKRLGHTVRKVAGRRVTDDDALEVAKMVYGGSINVELLGALKRHGAGGVGLSGVDADLITVARRPLTYLEDPATGTAEWVDFGHVGDVEKVDVHLLDVLLGAGFVPVVASLAADTEGHIYNVNADTIAAALAVALEASKLFLMTNVPGILHDRADRSTLIHEIDQNGIAALIEEGVIGGGMLPKVQNCVEALAGGVRRVHILDGMQAESQLLASFIRPGIGTLIVPPPAAEEGTQS